MLSFFEEIKYRIKKKGPYLSQCSCLPPRTCTYRMAKLTRSVGSTTRIPTDQAITYWQHYS